MSQWGLGASLKCLLNCTPEVGGETGEEGGGLRPLWDALSDLLNFRLLSNKFFLLIGNVSQHFTSNTDSSVL